MDPQNGNADEVEGTEKVEKPSTQPPGRSLPNPFPLPPSTRRAFLSEESPAPG